MKSKENNKTSRKITISGALARFGRSRNLFHSQCSAANAPPPPHLRPVPGLLLLFVFFFFFFFYSLETELIYHLYLTLLKWITDSWWKQWFAHLWDVCTSLWDVCKFQNWTFAHLTASCLHISGWCIFTEWFAHWMEGAVFAQMWLFEGEMFAQMWLFAHFTLLLLLWFIVKLCKVVARRLKYFAITYKIDSTYWNSNSNTWKISFVSKNKQCIKLSEKVNENSNL